MNTSKRYSPEVRERAVRLVLEQQKGYCVDTVGVDAEIIRKYVKYPEKRELRQQMNFRQQ